ncbi:MAG: helix-turn-helix transcriptional regulator [Actinocatenispora sp.]
MTERNDPSALRWLIGVELSNYRKRTTHSLSQVSEATKITKPKLGHMESGRYQQYPDDVAKVLQFYSADQHDIDRLTSLTMRSDAKAWWAPWSHVVPDWFRTFVGLEGLATSEFVYEPTLIPGLFQTQEYAEELTRATGFVRPDHSERFVSFRLARAGRLTENHPVTCHVVITEPALRLRVGTPELRRAQYQRLVELAARPNITMQVVRPEDGPHAAVAGPFYLLDFDAARPIVYAEIVDGARYVQDWDEVATYRLVADSVAKTALSSKDSVALINSLIDADR